MGLLVDLLLKKHQTLATAVFGGSFLAGFAHSRRTREPVSLLPGAPRQLSAPRRDAPGRTAACAQRSQGEALSLPPLRRLPLSVPFPERRRLRRAFNQRQLQGDKPLTPGVGAAWVHLGHHAARSLTAQELIHSPSRTPLAASKHPPLEPLSIPPPAVTTPARPHPWSLTAHER